MATPQETGYNDPRWHFPKAETEEMAGRGWDKLTPAEQEALDAGGISELGWETRSPAQRLKRMEEKELIQEEEAEAGIDLDDPADPGISLEEDGDDDEELEEDSTEELEALKRKARRQTGGGEARDAKEIAKLKIVVEKAKGEEVRCSTCRREPISTSNARCKYCNAPTLPSAFKERPDLEKEWEAVGGPDLEDDDVATDALLKELYGESDDFDDLLKDPLDTGKEFDPNNFKEVGADFEIGDYAGENFDLDEKIERYASYKTAYDLPGVLFNAIEKKRLEERWLINKLEPEREYLYRVFIQRWENDTTPPHKKRRAMLLSIQGALEAFPEPDSKAGLKKILSSDYDYLRAHMPGDQRYLVDQKLRAEAKKYKGGQQLDAPAVLWNKLNEEQRAKILLDLGVLVKGAGKKKGAAKAGASAKAGKKEAENKKEFKQMCPSCEAMVPVKDMGMIGKKIDCPMCKYRFVVEDPAYEEEEEGEEEVVDDFEVKADDEEEEKEEEKEETREAKFIKKAEDFDSDLAGRGLFAILRKIKPFKGEDGKEYDIEEQIGHIETARNIAEPILGATPPGEIDYDSIIFRRITNAHGLRDQVRKILEIEYVERPEVRASVAEQERVKNKLRVPLQDLNDLMLVFAPDLHFASLEELEEAIMDDGFESVDYNEEILECYQLMAGLGSMRRIFNKGGLTKAQVEDADRNILPDVVRRIGVLKGKARGIDSAWRGRENGRVVNLDAELAEHADDLRLVDTIVRELADTDFAQLPAYVRQLLMQFWNLKYEEAQDDWHALSTSASVECLRRALVSEWGGRAFDIMLREVDEQKEKKANPVELIEPGDNAKKKREKVIKRAQGCRTDLQRLEALHEEDSIPNFLTDPEAQRVGELLRRTEALLDAGTLNETGSANGRPISDKEYSSIEATLAATEREIELFTVKAKNADAWYVAREREEDSEIEPEIEALIDLDFDGTDDEVWNILCAILEEDDPAVNDRSLASAEWDRLGAGSDDRRSLLERALRRKRAQARAEARKKAPKKAKAAGEADEKEESVESQMEDITTLSGLAVYLDGQPNDGSDRRKVVNVVLRNLRALALRVFDRKFKEAREIIEECKQEVKEVPNHRPHRKEYLLWIGKIEELVNLVEAEGGAVVEWYYEGTDDATNEEESGTLKAASEQEAIEQLEAKKVTPTKLERKKQKEKVAASRKKKAAEEKKERVAKKVKKREDAKKQKKAAAVEDEDAKYVYSYDIYDDDDNVLESGTVEAEDDDEAEAEIKAKQAAYPTSAHANRYDFGKKTNWRGKAQRATGPVAPEEEEDEEEKEERKKARSERFKKYVKGAMVVAGTATAISGAGAVTELGLLPTAVVLAAPVIVRGFWDLGWAALMAPLDFAAGKPKKLTDYFGLPFVEDDALAKFLNQAA